MPIPVFSSCLLCLVPIVSKGRIENKQKCLVPMLALLQGDWSEESDGQSLRKIFESWNLFFKILLDNDTASVEIHSFGSLPTELLFLSILCLDTIVFKK